MFKINRLTEYGLMALHFLEDSPERVSAREMATELNIPFDPLSKVLQIMKKNAIVISKQGIKGGYAINKRLNEITLLELSTMIEGQHDGQCQEDKCCYYNDCQIKTPVHGLNTKLNHFFNSLNIKDFIQGTYEISL